MSKIVRNLNIFNGKIIRRAGFLKKLAATGILSTIIVGLCSSNLAFAEVGGGTRILATLDILQGK